MIENKIFDDIDEADLQTHIENRIPESASIDYKECTYGKADSDKKEFLKDVSSFANSGGGHLIIGMSEADGVPIAITPVKEADAELQRLESIARDGIEPQILGLQMKRVDTVGGAAIVVRVPRSWNPPHRVRFANSNRFWARNSAAAYEIGMEELRALFIQRISIEDRAKEFIRKRTEDIHVLGGASPLDWKSGSLLLHLVPLPDFGAGTVFDVLAAREQRGNLRTIGLQATSMRLNLEGLCIYSKPKRIDYTQLFRAGAIEAALTQITIETRESKADGRAPFISGLPFSKWLVESIPSYMRALRNIGAKAPIMLSVSLMNVAGSRLEPGPESFGNDVIFDKADMAIPPILIEDLGDDALCLKAVAQVLDVIWNAFDYDRCPYFSKGGEWLGGRNR